MHYTCHRCGHDVARTARDCGACGKPIAPLPWHRKIRAPGRRAPDAHVLDYARSNATPRFVMAAFTYAILVILALSAFRLVGDSSSLNPGTAQGILASMEGQGVDPHIRNALQHFFDALESEARALRIGCGLVAYLGVMGIILEAGTFRQTRRLVAMIDEPGGTPGDRAGGRP